MATSDDHMGTRKDLISAEKEYLNLLYNTSNDDFNPLKQRWVNTHTTDGPETTDMANVMRELERDARGGETT